MGKVHKGSAWASVRKQVLANADTCALCGKPLDAQGEQFKAPHPLSPSVDHIIPVASGGAPYDLSNLRPAHLGCNKQRGTRIDFVNVASTTTRNW